MKRFINFGSIEQYRTIVKNVQHAAQYQGQDDEGNPIYDRIAKMPVIEVSVSEKIHGTNAAVCYSIPDGFWVQSRNDIITPEKDNAGCAFNAEANKEAWVEIITTLAEDYKIDLNENIISIYYEWAGGNIQKNSALSGLNKKSIIFEHFKVSPIEPSENEKSYWLETSILPNNQRKIWLDYPEANIYNIMNFPSYKMTVDFNNPSLSQNQFVDLVEKHEHSSLVGKAFGIDDNICEGFVCTFSYKDSLHRFKVKGEKHTNSEVKTLKPVDEEKEQAKIDFANYACPAWRLEQMYDLANDTVNGGVPDIKNIGTFIKLVNQDILKEELDVLAEQGLEPKEIFPSIAKIIKVWYNEQLNKSLGL